MIEDIYEDGAYRQSRWEGILESPQVSPNNTGLFQFDLRNATLTRTHTKREGIPEEFRWAEGGEEYRDLSAALNRITRELGGL